MIPQLRRPAVRQRHPLRSRSRSTRYPGCAGARSGSSDGRGGEIRTPGLLLPDLDWANIGENRRVSGRVGIGRIAAASRCFERTRRHRPDTLTAPGAPRIDTFLIQPTPQRDRLIVSSAAPRLAVRQGPAAREGDGGGWAWARIPERVMHDHTDLLHGTTLLPYDLTAEQLGLRTALGSLDSLLIDERPGSPRRGCGPACPSRIWI
jgi:hypothetical protein